MSERSRTTRPRRRSSDIIRIDEELLEDSLDCQIDAGLYACEDESDQATATTAGGTTTTDFDDASYPNRMRGRRLPVCE